jgi:hypothetical protein
VRAVTGELHQDIGIEREPALGIDVGGADQVSAVSCQFHVDRSVYLVDPEARWTQFSQVP